MTDLLRLARKISARLGVEVVLSTDAYAGIPALYATINDEEQSGHRFAKHLGPPSKQERCLRALAEEVYHARGREKYRMQLGLCALCGGPMSGTSNTSIDHIKTRGAHGRDDRIENLRVVHGNPCHRKRHGG